jgi:general secretion pathway protein I
MWNGESAESEGLSVRHQPPGTCQAVYVRLPFVGQWRARQWRLCYPPGAAGFTLLEVMVALAIVAIALVPLLRLHLLSLDATMRAQDLTTAVLLAQEHLAALPPFPEPGEEKGGYDDPTLAGFRWQTVVTESEVILGESAQVVKLRHIAVTVLWIEGQREHHYTLETYVAQ